MFAENSPWITALFFLTTVFADPAQYSLLQNCDGTINTFSSALLSEDGLWWRGSEPCTVHVHADHAVDSQVRLEILDLKSDCDSHWLTLFDGPDERGRAISGKLCDAYKQLDTMYLTTTNTLTIVLSTGRDFSPQQHFKVKLLATSTSTENMDGSDFYCSNDFSVIIDLQCDGYNNCGDWSDESSSVCRPKLHVTAAVYGAIAAVLGLAVVLVVVVVIVVRKRRQQKRQMAAVLAGNKTGLVPQPPPYQSI